MPSASEESPIPTPTKHLDDESEFEFEDADSLDNSLIIPPTDLTKIDKDEWIPFSHKKKEKKKYKSKAKQLEEICSYSEALNNIIEAREDPRILQPKIKNPENQSVRFQPPSIKGGVLVDHQISSLNWMIDLYENNSNGILADQMGLGKTIQIISLFAYFNDFLDIKGPHLVVAPLVTTFNWRNEINKWMPSLRCVVLSARNDELHDTMKRFINPKKFDIIVTSYEGAQKHVHILSKIKFHTLIVDEAHRLKNNLSGLKRDLTCLKYRFCMLLTGTPLMNNLPELWSLLNFIMPELFYDDSLFLDYLEDENKNSGFTKDELVQKLHLFIKPLILRRLKKDTTLKLPPKKEVLVKVKLNRFEKDIYRKILLQDGEFGNTRNQLWDLRRLCMHPYSHPAVKELGSDPFGEHIVEASSKLKMLDMLLSHLKKGNHRCLIFSQLLKTIDILEDYCSLREHSYLRLDGSDSIENREEEIGRFQNEDIFIYLISTRAGGLGITLTAADTVIIYDSDWNPQIDLQAVDRTHRIGQTKPINVYRLIMENTVEEKIMEFQRIKLKVDYLFIEKGRAKYHDLERESDNPQEKISKQIKDDILNFGALEIFQMDCKFDFLTLS